MEDYLGSGIFIRKARYSNHAVVKITSDDWILVCDWSNRCDIATWSIHNKGTQSIYYGFAESPGANKYESLGVGEKEFQDTMPFEIWVKRSSNASEPTVVINYWTFNP